MTKYHKVNIFFFVFYILGMTIIMISQGIGITPDRYALILILGSLFIRRTRKFLIDWLPFLCILISYDFLRSFADKLGTHANFTPMIWFDKQLFGQLPTVSLQQHFFNPNQLHWYDFVATMFYFLHFALPLGFAFILWIKNNQRFKEFTNSLIFLSYSAFITYVVFPAAPPWLAAQNGLLPGVSKVLDFTLKSFPQKLDLPSIYYSFDPNSVAAMPSLHAAYPFLVFLFAYRFWGKKALPFLIYVVGAWVSIVYLGEHYVADVLAGIAYAGFAFYISERFVNSKYLAKSYAFLKQKISYRK